MKKHLGENLSSSFREYFEGMPDFKEETFTRHMRFIRDFPEKKLRIVITMPIFYSGDKTPHTAKGLHISFVMKFDDRVCLEFTDSRVINGWRENTTKKINTFIKLVLVTPLCPICGSLMYPNKSKDHQVNPRGTNFAWCTCSQKKCGNNVPTPYRTGLKTDISRYLKKE